MSNNFRYCLVSAFFGCSKIEINALDQIRRTKSHPAGEWTWVAMVYDGKVLRHFINGEKEMEGPVDFPPSASGKMSLGVRLNRVYWYKGAIGEVRFHPRALEGAELQKASSK